MLNISVEEIINRTEGKLVQGGNIIINNISTDTRSLKKNDFFIALEGPHYDGHDYIVDSYKKGAIGAMVEIIKLNAVVSLFKKAGYQKIPPEFLIIKVENTLRSLGLIAAFYRRRYNVKTIAISGSNGKTTTKELIYNLLLTKYKKEEVLKTEKNFNNEIGVPFTIFKLKPEVKIFIAELGINHIGEMQRLAYMVDPDYGVIINIGETHLEFLKNDKIVAKAKGEMLPFIRNTFIFNFDDKYFNYYMNLCKCRLKGFSLRNELDIRDINKFDQIENQGLKGFNIIYKGEPIKYNLIGEHNLYNLMAALTVVEPFKLNIKKVKRVIEKFKTLEDRGNVLKYKKLSVFFDAYNANPSSMKVLLSFISGLNYNNKIAVLGDMMELGKKAMKHHTEVLHFAQELEFQKIYLYGKYYSRVYRERLNDRMIFQPLKDFSAIAKELKKWGKMPQETICFIKGSRKMEMEKLLKLL